MSGPYDRPFHRNVRGFVEGPNRDNVGYSSSAYILDKEYATIPHHYVRAYLMLQADLEKLFEFLEPSDECLSAFSFRIHELLMRTCTEVEANLKAILKENTYTSSKFDMGVYKRINKTHHLSSYDLELPIWHGRRRPIRPFENWAKGEPLPWYHAYNVSKHDRRDSFQKASFKHLIDAVAGLLAVLSSQFKDQTFALGPDFISGPGPVYYDLKPTIGSLFRIKYPDDWAADEKYDFDWEKLKDQPTRFNKLDYDKIT
jgi:hypothetical protein